MTGAETYASRRLPSFHRFKNVLGGRIWKVFLPFARSKMIHVLQKGILHGSIEIIDVDGGKYVFGKQYMSPKPNYRHAKVLVEDEQFWARVYLSYDLGFSEAYMNGDFTTPDLKDVLLIFVDNMATLRGVVTCAFILKEGLDIIAQRFVRHGYQASIKNVADYDASNDFYKAFLSREMQYSCPLWGDEEGGVRGDLEGHSKPNDLEAAQERKIDYMLKRVRLKPGGRLLEIGSGWGSTAIAAAKMGCTVDTLTLSAEQKKLAEERIREAGLEDMVKVHLMDYRNMPSSFEKAFDGCVSFEMIEAVGVKYMPTYIKKIDWALKDKNAAVVISATAYPDATFSLYQGNSFIREYHWPNTIPPSATWLATQFRDVSNGKFSLDWMEDFGPHYCRCLREWNRRMTQNWTPDLIASLMKRYPEFEERHLLEVFKRRWEYMFVYMEVAYSTVWLNLNTWCFVRKGYPIENCA